MHLHIHMQKKVYNVLHISRVHVILEPLGAIRCTRRGNGWKNPDDRRDCYGMEKGCEDRKPWKDAYTPEI